MNIGMTHFRVGETDGVSLEMDKWKKVLERKGHKVFYIAGTQGTTEAIIIPEMDYRGTEDHEINALCYEDCKDYSEARLMEKVEEMADRIEASFIKIIKEYKIDLLSPNNLLSLGRSPHISMAITRACIKTGIKVIGHHHDFYWERDYFKHPQYPYVEKLLANYFPPKDLDMKHVVINKPAQKDLKTKKNQDAFVVPNVFDFKVPSWEEYDYNLSYNKDMGIGDNEIVFLQATRVTNRKAIELAVDLIALLNTDEYRDKLIGKTLYNGKKFNKEKKMNFAMVGLHESEEKYEEELTKND